MKSIKILLLLSSLLFMSQIFAQGKRQGGDSNKTPQEVALKRAERWQKELNLTDDQKKQVTALIEKKVTAMRSGDKEKAKQARQDFRTELKQILTPEQQEKLKAKMLERKAKRKTAKSSQSTDDDDDDAGE